MNLNLYIINDVLCDYTPGMVVIAAESLEKCREIFEDRFGDNQFDNGDFFS